MKQSTADRLVGMVVTLAAGLALVFAQHRVVLYLRRLRQWKFKTKKAVRYGDPYFRSRWVQQDGEELEIVDHHGSCGCGRFVFSLSAPPDLRALDCPAKLRYPHVFVPAEAFAPLADIGLLTLYSCNTSPCLHQEHSHLVVHAFCAKCGVPIFRASENACDTLVVNVDCLDASSIRSLEVTYYEDLVAFAEDAGRVSGGSGRVGEARCSSTPGGKCRSRGGEGAHSAKDGQLCSTGFIGPWGAARDGSPYAGFFQAVLHFFGGSSIPRPMSSQQHKGLFPGWGSSPVKPWTVNGDGRQRGSAGHVSRRRGGGFGLSSAAAGASGVGGGLSIVPLSSPRASDASSVPPAAAALGPAAAGGVGCDEEEARDVEGVTLTDARLWREWADACGSNSSHKVQRRVNGVVSVAPAVAGSGGWYGRGALDEEARERRSGTLMVRRPWQRRGRGGYRGRDDGQGGWTGPPKEALMYQMRYYLERHLKGEQRRYFLAASAAAAASSPSSSSTSPSSPSPLAIEAPPSEKGFIPENAETAEAAAMPLPSPRVAAVHVSCGGDPVPIVNDQHQHAGGGNGPVLHLAAAQMKSGEQLI